MITSNLETDSVLGKIVAISDNYSNDEKLDVGTTVIISKFSGNKIQHDNNEYLVVDIDSILAIVEEE